MENNDYRPEFRDGEFIACFTGYGQIWFMFTDVSHKHTISLSKQPTRLSKDKKNRQFASQLSNHVASDNKTSSS